MPEPYLDRFFPEAFVTREELINLIMLLDGKDEQISTSMVVDKDLHMPHSIKKYIPEDWSYSLDLVTKKEALDILFALFKYEHDSLLGSDAYSLNYPTETVRDIKFGIQQWIAQRFASVRMFFVGIKETVVNYFKRESTELEKEELVAIVDEKPSLISTVYVKISDAMSGFRDQFSRESSDKGVSFENDDFIEKQMPDIEDQVKKAELISDVNQPKNNQAQLLNFLVNESTEIDIRIAQSINAIDDLDPSFSRFF